MKVIDLLNKIANGEETPKKIKFENYIYNWRNMQKDYYCEKINHSLESIIGEYLFNNLDLEVEIIEEKEIEKIEELNLNHEYYLPSKELVEDYEFKKFVLDELFAQYDKINELVKVVNGLKKTGEIK